MDIKSYTAKKIKEYRKLRNLTQKELGEKIGVKHNTISGYENGTNEPEQDLLFKIASALEISINDLFPPTKYSNNDLPPLTKRDEAQIAKDLEKMLSDLDNNTEFAAHGGTVEDSDDKELLKAALLTSMKIAKRMAKEKFTPKKYKNKEESKGV